MFRSSSLKLIPPEGGTPNQIKRAISNELDRPFCFASSGLTTGRWSVAVLEQQAGETYAFVTFSACGPFGPCVTSNSTS